MHPTLLKVHAGSNHLITNGTLHEVASFIMHTGFNSSDFSSEDIALVEVLQPFEFGETTQPAKLPAQDEATPEGSPAWSIGWGFVDVILKYYFHFIKKI
jgi:Trypsin